MAKPSKTSANMSANIKPVAMIVLGYLVVSIITMFLLPTLFPSIYESYSEWLNGKVNGSMVQSKVATPTPPETAKKPPPPPPELSEILTEPGQKMLFVCTHGGCHHCKDFVKAGLDKAIEQICLKAGVPYVHAKGEGQYPTLYGKPAIDYFPQVILFVVNDDGTIKKVSHDGPRETDSYEGFILGSKKQTKGVNAMLSFAEDESGPLPGIQEPMAKPDISISNDEQMPLHGPPNNVEPSQDSGSSIDIAAVQPAASSGFARRGSGVPFSE